VILVMLEVTFLSLFYSYQRETHTPHCHSTLQFQRTFGTHTFEFRLPCALVPALSVLSSSHCLSDGAYTRDGTSSKCSSLILLPSLQANDLLEPSRVIPTITCYVRASCFLPYKNITARALFCRHITDLLRWSPSTLSSLFLPSSSTTKTRDLLPTKICSVTKLVLTSLAVIRDIL